MIPHTLSLKPTPASNTTSMTQNNNTPTTRDKVFLIAAGSIAGALLILFLLWAHSITHPQSFPWRYLRRLKQHQWSPYSYGNSFIQNATRLNSRDNSTQVDAVCENDTKLESYSSRLKHSPFHYQDAIKESNNHTESLSNVTEVDNKPEEPTKGEEQETKEELSKVKDRRTDLSFFCRGVDNTLILPGLPSTNMKAEASEEGCVTGFPDSASNLGSRAARSGRQHFVTESPDLETSSVEEKEREDMFPYRHFEPIDLYRRESDKIPVPSIPSPNITLKSPSIMKNAEAKDNDNVTIHAPALIEESDDLRNKNAKIDNGNDHSENDLTITPAPPSTPREQSTEKKIPHQPEPNPQPSTPTTPSSTQFSPSRQHRTFKPQPQHKTPTKPKLKNKRRTKGQSKFYFTPFKPKHMTLYRKKSLPLVPSVLKTSTSYSTSNSQFLRKGSTRCEDGKGSLSEG